MSGGIENLNRDSINESMYTVWDRARGERSEIKERIRVKTITRYSDSPTSTRSLASWDTWLEQKKKALITLLRWKNGLV